MQYPARPFLNHAKPDGCTDTFVPFVFFVD
jgi:hypothetical protein